MAELGFFFGIEGKESKGRGGQRGPRAPYKCSNCGLVAGHNARSCGKVSAGGVRVSKGEEGFFLPESSGK
jgi:hypothetical protein